MNENAVLTRRESQIAELIAWGATKKDIANRLYISTRTVENTVRNIFQKTGVTKSNELSAWYFCKSFKISYDLSPLKIKIIAVILFAMLVPKEVLTTGDMFRTRTSKTARAATSRKGKETDYLFLA